MFSTFHVPSTDETTRFDDLWFERERNKFFFEKKTGASEDHRCGWFINFSFKLAACIFKKKFQNYDFQKKKKLLEKRSKWFRKWFRTGSIFVSRRARLYIHMVPKIDAVQDVYRES